ncbi:M20/M25/M40 family metallo-hydrolase [Bradyrhizobium sp. GCM10027634]|uniref:M20/M25/M40 family metallo-hydrolase n=1 Tax=unclassified Bradyrhizobium TaxID=2631580 RepID=UPI00263A966D|nr:M20/M25/M40 family metallo-hydrolase [Bradyrhizobium sp. WYCCWR 12677]MDN5004402.1 M20/M25/M40 family metallo-hydrolase [Bradyrhizobium sp. WYCCWR 12677]
MFWTFVGLAFGLIVTSALVVVVRTFQMTSTPVAEPGEPIAVDAASAANHLAGAIAFRTIAQDDSCAAFQGLEDFLSRTYKLTHERLARQRVGKYALLYEWMGRDRSKSPIVLMAHLDVVPVLSGSEATWSYAPFSGTISNGYVYGRGALDDKSAVIALFEAAEQLLQTGYKPERTIYFALGDDEEIGGEHGAKEIVKLLRSRKLGDPALVLDEGGAVVEGRQLGLATAAAMIGIAEKGYVSLELSAHGSGGHSSTPTFPTQIGRLARAIAALEANQFPTRLDGATLEMLTTIAPTQPFGTRLVMANLWLFRPLVIHQLLSDPRMATFVRTTTAPTVISGGNTENVLPDEAKAVVNFQILQGDTINSVLERVREVINDTMVEVRLLSGIQSDPSPISDVSGPAFAAIAKSVRESIGPNPPLVVPFLTGPTDSRHWSATGARNVFRFTPFAYEQDWMLRAHGTNERISVQALADGVRFYTQLIRNTEGL